MHNALSKGYVNIPEITFLLAPSMTLGNNFFPLAGQTVPGMGQRGG